VDAAQPARRLSTTLQGSRAARSALRGLRRAAAQFAVASGFALTNVKVAPHPAAHDFDT